MPASYDLNTLNSGKPDIKYPFQLFVTEADPDPNQRRPQPPKVIIKFSR